MSGAAYSCNRAQQSRVFKDPMQRHAGAKKCAGQDCPERTECYRYLRPAAPLQHWASFDIERAHFGTCESKREVRNVNRINLQRAMVL